MGETKVLIETVGLKNLDDLEKLVHLQSCFPDARFVWETSGNINNISTGRIYLIRPEHIYCNPNPLRSALLQKPRGTVFLAFLPLDHLQLPGTQTPAHVDTRDSG